MAPRQDTPHSRSLSRQTSHFRSGPCRLWRAFPGRTQLGRSSRRPDRSWQREACHRGPLISQTRGKQTRKLVDDLAGDLSDNLDRMKYPEYRDRRLRISSAAVESANFHVTGTRLKLQGMRWSAEGAAQMAVLRADLFNGHWEKRTRRLLAA